MGESVSYKRDSNIEDQLYQKIKALNATAWKDKWHSDSDTLEPWLRNFARDEREQAMYLLSKFMYFDNSTTRELMLRIYEDLYKRPVIYDIRRNNNNTLDNNVIDPKFKAHLKTTRFIGIGNPSESGAHLLYYFRQENMLPRELFINPFELFVHNIDDSSTIQTQVNTNGITHIVVLDDFCGSGTQATSFNNSFVKIIKEKCPEITISYYALYAIEEGKKVVESLDFDEVKAVFVLDQSYKCFSKESRFFPHSREGDEYRIVCKKLCKYYGKKLKPKNPLGFKNCQMLLGFHHNTPNNTLPIFWSDTDNWTPIFKRYAKIY